MEAKGTNGQLELLRDKVLIKRQGHRARGLGGDREIPIEQITSVEFKNAGRMVSGYIQLVFGRQEDRTGLQERSRGENAVGFNYQQREPFVALKEAIEQRIAESPGLAKVPEEMPKEEIAQALEKPEEASVATVPVSKVAGGVEVLNKKLRKLAEQNMGEDESIEFCLLSQSGVGGWSQVIVALDERLLVIKPGMAAGATFGARVTSFYYRDITGIEINTGLLQGVIEINTPSYQGTAQKDYWNVRDQNKNPFLVTNCLPISKRDLKHYKPYIDKLRTMIREAKQERVTPLPPQGGNNLSSELDKLASLKASGVLTEEEFQQAKKRVLD